MKITLSSFWKSALFFALWLIFFLYGLQETEKLTGVPANRIQHLWICAGAILWVLAVYHLYCPVSKPVSWLAVVLFRLISWPVLMLKSGYGKVLIGIDLCIGVVPFYMTLFFAEKIITTLYGAIWYLIFGAGVNLFFMNIGDNGFINFPKISDFKEEVANE